MKQRTQQFVKNRKFFMVLPVLVLPFLSVIFWVLGGGQGTVQANTNMNVGLNAELPDPHFEEKEIWDKLNLYEIADRDSAKFEEARESDPYFDLVSFKTQPDLKSDDTTQSKLIDSFKTKDRLSAESAEQQVNLKLEALYKEMNKVPAAPLEAHQNQNGPVATTEFSLDVDRLEKMMEMMADTNQEDPEMQQIESVLEKILDVQHPDRVKERQKEQMTRSEDVTFQVEAVDQHNTISELNSPANQFPSQHDSLREVPSIEFTSQNSFYGLEDEMIGQQHAGNAIQAVIHGTQELVTGSTVRMRLTSEVSINGQLIQKDQFIHGICGINGERLTIEISSVRFENSLLPVSLAVYDLDGLEGIYIPGAISRDAAKQAGDDALQNVQLMSMDPTIGQQAAGAGIEAAKGLLSKKTKLIKVTVKAGYQILLKDAGQSSTFN